MQKSGVVAKVAGPNKGGYYAVKIEGDDTWYSVPDKTSGGVEQGDSITFDATKSNRGFWSLDVNSISKVPVNTGSGVPGGVQGRESYWQDKAQSDVANHREIRWRSAVNSAINIIELADKMDANPIPKNGKKGDKFDLLLKLVDETAQGIYKSFASANLEDDQFQFDTISRLTSGDEFEDAGGEFPDTTEE